MKRYVLTPSYTDDGSEVWKGQCRECTKFTYGTSKSQVEHNIRVHITSKHREGDE